MLISLVLLMNESQGRVSWKNTLGTGKNVSNYMDVVELTLIKKFLALNVLLTFEYLQWLKHPPAHQSPTAWFFSKVPLSSTVVHPRQGVKCHGAVKPVCRYQISEGYLESKFTFMDSLGRWISHRSKLLVPVCSETKAWSAPQVAMTILQKKSVCGTGFPRPPYIPGDKPGHPCQSDTRMDAASQGICP